MVRLFDKNSIVKELLLWVLVELDLIQFTDLLEQYRESLFDAEINPITDQFSANELTPQAHEKAVQFLSNKRLLENIDKLLEQSGIVGEEENRKLLFILASSYKMPYLLHALIQGTSGEGKSHLLNSIAECMPQEDVMNLTRITSKSLYHYREKELMNKLILIQDFDGLDEEAQFAFREMQSAKFLSSSTVVKNAFGQTRGMMKQVQAHFSSLTATTKAEVYYDNMSRSVVLGVDESQDRHLEALGHLHQAQGLAVPFRARHAEVALDLLLGVTALLVADHHHCTAVDAGQTTHDRLVIGEGTVAGQLLELAADQADVVVGIRPRRVAGAPRPGCANSKTVRSKAASRDSSICSITSMAQAASNPARRESR